MPMPIPGGRRRVDRVLAPDFVDDVEGLDLDDLRARRRDAEQEEADLSYLRRMLHGRLDIVLAEIRQREIAGGESIAIDQLVEILTDDRPASRGSGRHAAVEPSRVDEHRRSVERVVADAVISDVKARSDEELTSALERLRDHERDISAARVRVQGVVDALTGELTRRYREGLVDINATLQGPGPDSL